MEFSVRVLRAWAVPYAVPVSGATAALADSGALHDEMIQLQLRTLGAEVVPGRGATRARSRASPAGRMSMRGRMRRPGWVTPRPEQPG